MPPPSSAGACPPTSTSLGPAPDGVQLSGRHGGPRPARAVPVQHHADLIGILRTDDKHIGGAAAPDRREFVIVAYAGGHGAPGPPSKRSTVPPWPTA